MAALVAISVINEACEGTQPRRERSQARHFALEEFGGNAEKWVIGAGTRQRSVIKIVSQKWAGARKWTKEVPFKGIPILQPQEYARILRNIASNLLNSAKSVGKPAAAEVEKMARSIWGWGYESEQLKHKDNVGLMGQFLPCEASMALEEVPPSSAALRAPRFSLQGWPDRIKAIMTDDKIERMRHSYGKSFRDTVRGFQGLYPNPPDYVALPRTEQDVVNLVNFVAPLRIPVIPYGGGSSVVGGVEPCEGQWAISLDLRNLDQLLEVNKQCLTARFQGGVFGPRVLQLLKPHGLTLRHFPQSFEFSTVGGWVATRAGGHYATGMTHIDEFVVCVRVVTPTGVVQTQRIPSSGAGPSENRLFIGSEGTLGIITEVCLRVQETVKYRTSTAVTFDSFEAGVEAARRLSQSGLNPSNCRLVDATESLGMGLSKTLNTTLIVGFESSLVEDLSPWMKPALQICRECGGNWDESKVSKPVESADEGNLAAVAQWKNSFLNAPYLRDALVRRGYIIETFESATSWDVILKLDKEIRAAVQRSAPNPDKVLVTVRFTHLYSDGPAPYWTVVAVGSKGKQVQEWDRIKAAVTQVLVENGATTTHHHAVGRDHAPFYMREKDGQFLKALFATKARLDPNLIMNPGVLFPLAEVKSLHPYSAVCRPKL